jgi:hypothetical protein
MAAEFCRRTYGARRVLLHAVNLRHGTDGFTSPPKEGVLRILITRRLHGATAQKIKIWTHTTVKISTPKSQVLCLQHRSSNKTQMQEPKETWLLNITVSGPIFEHETSRIPRLDCYSSRQQIACFKATEGLHSPYRAALCHQYSVASFATLRVLGCLHSPGLRCSCCNVARFFCDPEACDVRVKFVCSHKSSFVFRKDLIVRNVYSWNNFSSPIIACSGYRFGNPKLTYQLHLGHCCLHKGESSLS